VLVIRVFVALCQPEIDNVDVILGALGSANQEIVGLNVSVNNALFVNFLNALDLKFSLNFKVEIKLTICTAI